MVLFSIAPFFITTQSGEEMVGAVYLWTAIASGALMVGLSAWVIVKPMEKGSLDIVLNSLVHTWQYYLLH